MMIRMTKKLKDDVQKQANEIQENMSKQFEKAQKHQNELKEDRKM
jgi:hypothetical protein